MKYDFSKTNIKRVIKKFKKEETKRGPFFQYFKANGEFPTFDVECDRLFEDAVWEGYLDANRTFTGVIDTKSGAGAFHNLAIVIQKYFKDGKVKFDHENWCDKFVKDMKDLHSCEARYGQAQKVVNMAFKYLYCCPGADIYRDKFNECHMPLDQYTLEWYKNECGIQYVEWSYFSKASYKEVSGRIKEILKEDILGKELVIWNLQKNIKIVDLKEEYEAIK